MISSVLTQFCFQCFRPLTEFCFCVVRPYCLFFCKVRCNLKRSGKLWKKFLLQNIFFAFNLQKSFLSSFRRF